MSLESVLEHEAAKKLRAARAQALECAVRFAPGCPPPRLVDLAEAFMFWIDSGDRVLIETWSALPPEPEPLEVRTFDKQPALRRAAERREARRRDKVAQAAAMLGGEE